MCSYYFLNIFLGLKSDNLHFTPCSIAQMAELVDAHGSGPCALGCGGSSPLLGTKTKFSLGMKMGLDN